MGLEERIANLGQVCLMNELRVMRRLTQQDLAERLGTRQSTVSKIEQREDPTLSVLRHYVEALGGELLVMVRFADGIVEYCLGHDDPPISR